MGNLDFLKHRFILFVLAFTVTDLLALPNIGNNILRDGSSNRRVIEPKEPGADDSPLQPLTVTIIGRTQSSMTVRWRDRSNFENENRLYRKSLGQDWQLIATFGDIDNWYTYADTPLSSGYHCYRLQASNGNGNSPFSPQACSYSAGYLHKRLKLLTYNVYGTDEGDCSKRARVFGENVASSILPYDIVGLQEYYDSLDADIVTCDAHHLSDAIWSTGLYRNSDNYYRFYPSGEFLDLEADGGIGIFTRYPIKKFDEWEWYHGQSFWDGSVQGFIFSQIKIPYSPVTIDTYIVHLDANVDGCNRICRQAELQRLAYTISQRSRNSGNPVIVMGDFNIDGAATQNGNAGYDDILDAFHHPRDLWRENHPLENGYTTDNCWINPPTDCTDGGERIDFIFILDDKYFSNSRFNLTVAVADDVKVKDWRWTTVNYPHFHRVSDHFGVEATLEVRERSIGTGGFEFCQMEKDAYENAIVDLERTDELIRKAAFFVKPIYFNNVRPEDSALVAETKAAYKECKQNLIRSVPKKVRLHSVSFLK